MTLDRRFQAERGAGRFLENFRSSVDIRTYDDNSSDLSGRHDKKVVVLLSFCYTS